MKHFYFSLILTAISFLKINSQTSQNSGEQIKNYTYIFTGNINTEQVKLLEETISKIEFVTSAKIKYKPENGNGIVYFKTLEKTLVREGDAFFEIKKVKNKLEEFHTTPKEFKIEN